MKHFIVSFFLIVFSFMSCKQKDANDLRVVNSATVQFLEAGPCCSNMELMNQEPVFSDLAGYSETILAAVNINKFSVLGIENKDSLLIYYTFSSDEFPCDIICNRHNGIPIELVTVEKL